MLETADRLVAEESEPSLQHVPAARRRLRALSGRERDPALGARRVPPALDGPRGLGARVHRLRPLRRRRARTGCVLTWPPAARCARAAGRRARLTPSPETLELMGALLAGDWPVADAAATRHPPRGIGLVAAFLQWHLERGLRSLPLRRAPLTRTVAAQTHVPQWREPG